MAAVVAVGRFDFLRYISYSLFGHVTLLLMLSVFWLRTVSKLASVLCGIVALALWGVAFDAFIVEPSWLQVSRYEISSEKLTRPLRIVVVADIQTDQFGRHERRALQSAARQKPDLLLFAGDYVQSSDPDTYHSVARQINAQLRELCFTERARAFAVRGNVDGERWVEIFAGTDAQAVCQTQSFRFDDVLLICLSREDSFNPGLTVQHGGPEEFHIVLGHSPNFALGHAQADLLLAGHTHGGQVQLPFVGPLLTNSRIPRSWASGMTGLPNGGALLVSRGVGMERDVAPRLRFLCRPELVVIDVRPSPRGARLANATPSRCRALKRRQTALHGVR
jgi:predicted MPP superfamily phosphohydrolase